MRRSWSSLAVVFAAMIAGITYFVRLPSTVQMGDTGEMVANAYRLFVPHPPGYPLFTWIMYPATNWMPGATVFWKASFVNSLFAVATVALLAYRLRKTPLIAIGFALTLAFSRIFWKFAELPDVFALNAFIAGVIVLLYVEPAWARARFLVPFVFALAISHHHTIVFLAPVVLHVMSDERRNAKMWIGLVMGTVITAGLYLSLMAMNPSHFWSWGMVDSVHRVWLHFLRDDFGTFKLIGNSEKGSSFSNLERFVSQSIPVLVVMCAAFAANVRSVKWRGREIMLTIGLVGYVGVFSFLSNMELYAFRLETFDRFLIFAQVLLCFMVASVLGEVSLTRWRRAVLVVAVFAGTIYSYVTYSTENDYSKNTIVEDYSLNLLNLRQPGEPALLLIVTDTRYNGIKYAQTVMNVQPDVLAVHPTLLNFKWFARKAVRDGLVLDLEKLWKEKDIYDYDGFIASNAERYDVITNLMFENTDRYKVTLAPLGRRIEPGVGLAFQKTVEPWFARSALEATTTPNSDYDVFRDLWNDYGIYSFKRADVLYKQNDREGARLELLKALEVVPWSLTTRANLCVIEKDLGRDPTHCYEELGKTKDENFTYY